MTEINRRKFLSIFGFISVGGLIRYQDDAKALEISVNRFNNDKKVNLQNIHSIAINIKDTRITSNNIDYSKDAELSIYAKVEDQDIGKIKSKDIKLQNSGTVLDDETIYIDEPELFSEDNFNPNKKKLRYLSKI